jgi:hypothetical protein
MTTEGTDGPDGPDGLAVAERENAWAGQGAVLLDIGGDVGALVVVMPDSAIGLEVEIRGLDGQPPVSRHAHEHSHPHAHPHAHDRLDHVAVVARPVAGGHQPSLVFAELEKGPYQLFEKGRPDAVALTVDVAGGAVTWGAWPG